MLQLILLFLNLSLSDLKKNYDRDELLYFSETAFYQQTQYAKWEGPITVELTGAYTLQDSLFIKNIFDELAPYVNIDIGLVSSNGNLKIHFVDESEIFNRIFKKKKQSCPLGFMQPLIKKNEILKADIYLHPSLLADKKNEVIKHEICHALGLMGHSNKSFYHENMLANMIYKNLAHKNSTLLNKSIPILDKKALYMLYHAKRNVLRKENFNYLLAQSHETVSLKFN